MIKTVISATLYTALSLTAIPAGADVPAPLSELATGEMKKLVVHSDPKKVSDVAFTMQDGTDRVLGDYTGDVTVVNFWATWCAPCRAEMPALDALAQRFTEDDVTVVPIATGHNPVPAIERFFDEAGIETLTYATDAKSKLARDMAVLGLPVTIIVDQTGQEVARLTGDADWASDDAFAVIENLLAPQ